MKYIFTQKKNNAIPAFALLAFTLNYIYLEEKIGQSYGELLVRMMMMMLMMGLQYLYSNQLDGFSVLFGFCIADSKSYDCDCDRNSNMLTDDEKDDDEHGPFGEVIMTTLVVNITLTIVNTWFSLSH